MIRKLFSLALLLLMAAACVNDVDKISRLNLRYGKYAEFYATIESCPDTETKVYADKKLRVLWNENDRISVFNNTTGNMQFLFAGEDGDNAGGFTYESGSSYGKTISHIYSVYPFSKATTISEEGILSLTLPITQTYHSDSFGIGANTMVSVSDDNNLRFKNAGGFLSLKFFGEGISVKSISLKGNNGEKLAGKAKISIAADGTPTIEMQETATETLILNCPTPVALGDDSEHFTEFWFVIPPTTFKNGFTVTVSDDQGGIFEMATNKQRVIERNRIIRMSPLKVETQSVLDMLCTEWGTDISAVKSQMGSASLLSEDESSLFFRQDVSGVAYSYLFHEGGLCTSSCTLPEGTAAGILSNFHENGMYFGFIDDYEVFRDEKKNFLLFSYSLTEKGKTYDVLGFTPIHSVAFPLMDPLALSIGDASEIGPHFATLSATLTGADEEFSCGFYYDSRSDMSKKINVSLKSTNSFSSALKGLRASTTYYYQAWADTEEGLLESEVKSFSTKEYVFAAEAVDLGLSVLWASHNLGADDYWDPGDYYSWGETEPKDSYVWGNYKWYDNGSITKYNTEERFGFVDNKVVLDDEDDAAFVLTNGEWRIPTKEELKELISQCKVTHVWINDNQGRLFTSNNNDNQLFFPEAGYKGNEPRVRNLNSEGSYLSNTISDLRGCVYGMRLTTGNRPYIHNTLQREIGLSIRPVKSIRVTEVTLNEYELELIIGDSFQLNATISPSRANNKSLSWESSDPSVASVSFNGNVHALSEGAASITVTSKDGNHTAVCEVTVSKMAVDGVSLNMSDMVLTEGEELSLSASVSPSNATNKNIRWTSSSTDIATVSSSGMVTAISEGTTTITVTSEDGGFSDHCTVTVEIPLTDEHNGYYYIDLGLPSGLKWATYNVGATRPEDYGEYYAWGETSTKSYYSYSNYLFRCAGTSESSPKFTRYVTKSDYGSVDKKTTLTLSDDVAHSKWGGKWRIPTKSDFDELKANCEFVWRYRNGVPGWEIISNNNGNKIFLPASSRWYDKSAPRYGSDTHYWSSSIYTERPSHAWTLRLYGEESNFHSIVVFDRFVGYPIRPVTE